VRAKPTLSELTFPFALVGLVAGWLSAGLLANPVIGVAVAGQQGVAAVIAGLIGAVIGTLLGRLHVPRNAFAEEGPPWIPVALYLIPGGAITGGAVGWIASGGHGNGLSSGLLNGLICAPGFVPVGTLVLSAARRARRARLGSIVAGSDARSIWSILAIALSVTTLAALPDWAAWRHARAALPHAALAMADGAAVLIACLMVADAVALVRVVRLGRQQMEQREPEDDAAREAAAREAIPTTDLGLGEEVMAQLARGAAVYRSQERTVALLLGSVTEARAALRRALWRGAAGLAIAGATLACHAWAAGEGGLIAYGAIRCAQGSSRSCADAGLRLAGLTETGTERPGIPSEVGCAAEPNRGYVRLPIPWSWEGLLSRGCNGGEARACTGLATLHERCSFEDRAQQAWERACTAGHAEACRRAALTLGPAHAGRAASLLRTGCGWGDHESCALAPAFSDRAAQAAGKPPR
jgi:hypothetical protein